MEENKICRGCLAKHTSTTSTSKLELGVQVEEYLQLINECFNINLVPSPKSVICDFCTINVEACIKFKKKVLQTEKNFIKIYLSDTCEEAKPFIKEEVTFQNAAEDSDDCTLVDTDLKEEYLDYDSSKDDDKNLALLALEQLQSKGGITVKRRKRRRDHKHDQVKLKNEIKLEKNEQDLKVNKNRSKQIKPVSINIKKNDTRSNAKAVYIRIDQKLPGTERWEKPPKLRAKIYRTEKQKHAYNLQTVLQFSNATLFKNKTLLGYQCGFCELTFPDPAVLRAHADSTHKQKDRLLTPLSQPTRDWTDTMTKVDVTDLKCNLCDDGFDNLHQLKLHLTKKHGKVIYSDIKDHIIQFKLKQGDVYDCALCSSTYETFKMLTQHMNVHYSNYKCSECETSFATKRSLSAHRNVHVEGSYKCTKCDKVFLSKVKRQYHERMKHLGVRNISNCHHCNEPFRSYYQRNQHMVQVHNLEAQYKCKICDKPYLLKSLLMNHIKKNHLMERNIQCAECGYKFFSNKGLKAHMVKHTGERNYSCSVCNKSYGRKYTLREHMRIHNNDRRFKCAICELTFVQKCSLKSHLLSNHGISMPASEITSNVQDV